MVAILITALLANLNASLPVANYRQLYPIVSNRIGDGWGVNIHFTEPQPGEVRLIRKAGFHWVRMDFIWNAIEKSPGQYDFKPYDILMRHLRMNGMRPIFILDYGNDLYQHGSPTTEKAVSAFCKFVRASVEHFKNQGIVWEMWNEPNIGFWQPQPNVEQYIHLATEVGKTIREVAPTEWYVGPACSTFDWKFLEACFKGGLLRYFDGVTVHPYRGSAPETVVADWTKLKGLIHQYAPAGRSIPMISGEWGYPSVGGGVSEATQAAYALRMYLCNMGSGVPLSIWYDWKNDGPNPNNSEHRFGLVEQDLKPKAAYKLILNFEGKYEGWKFDPSDFMDRFGLDRKVDDVISCQLDGPGTRVKLSWKEDPQSVPTASS